MNAEQTNSNEKDWNPLTLFRLVGVGGGERNLPALTLNVNNFFLILKQMPI